MLTSVFQQLQDIILLNAASSDSSSKFIITAEKKIVCILDLACEVKTNKYVNIQILQLSASADSLILFLLSSRVFIKYVM
jgi:hypothetical protein